MRNFNPYITTPTSTPATTPENQGKMKADMGSLYLDYGLDFNHIGMIDREKFDISLMDKSFYMERFAPRFSSPDGAFDQKLFDSWYEHMEDGQKLVYENTNYGPEALPNPYKARSLKPDFSIKPMEFDWTQSAFLGGGQMISNENAAFTLNNNQYLTKEGIWADWDESWTNRLFGNFIVDHDQESGKPFVREIPSNVPAHGYEHLSIWGPQHLYSNSLMGNFIGGFASAATVELGSALATLGHIAQVADNKLVNGAEYAERQDKLRREFSELADDHGWAQMFNFFEKISYKPAESVKQGGWFAPQSLPYNLGNGIGMLLPQRYGAGLAVKVATRAFLEASRLGAMYAGKQGAELLTRKAIREMMKAGVKDFRYNRYIEGFLPAQKQIAMWTATGIGTAQAMQGVWESAMINGLDEDDALKVALISLPAVIATERVLGARWITEGIGQSSKTARKMFWNDKFLQMPKGYLKSLADNPSKGVAYFAKHAGKMYDSLSTWINKVPTAKVERILQSAAKGTIREGMQEGPLEEGWYIMSEWLHDKYWSEDYETEGFGKYGTKLFDRKAFGRVGENMMAGMVLGGLFDAVFIGSQRDEDVSQTLITGILNNRQGLLNQNLEYWKKAGQTTGSPDYSFDGNTLITPENEGNVAQFKVNPDGSLNEFGIPKDYTIKTQKDFNYYTYALAFKYWDNIIKFVNSQNPAIIQLFKDNGQIIEPVMKLASEFKDSNIRLNQAIEADRANPTDDTKNTIKAETANLESLQKQMGYYLTPVKDGYSQALMDMVRNDSFTRMFAEESLLKNEKGFTVYTNSVHDVLWSEEKDENGLPIGHFPRHQLFVKQLEERHLEALRNQQEGNPEFTANFEKLKKSLDQKLPNKAKGIAEMLDLAVSSSVTPYEQRLSPAQHQALKMARESLKKLPLSKLDPNIEATLMEALEGVKPTDQQTQIFGQQSLDEKMAELNPYERTAFLNRVSEIVEEIPNEKLRPEIMSLMQAYHFDISLSELEQEVDSLRLDHSQSVLQAEGLIDRLGALVAIKAFSNAGEPIPDHYREQIMYGLSKLSAPFSESTMRQLFKINGKMAELASTLGIEFTGTNPENFIPQEDLQTILDALNMSENGFAMKDTPEGFKKSYPNDWETFQASIEPDEWIPGVEQAREMATAMSLSLESEDRFRRRRQVPHDFVALRTIVSAMNHEENPEKYMPFETVQAEMEALQKEIFGDGGELLLIDTEIVSEEAVDAIVKRILKIKSEIHRHLVDKGLQDEFITRLVGKKNWDGLLVRFVNERLNFMNGRKLTTRLRDYDYTLKDYAIQLIDYLQINPDDQKLPETLSNLGIGMSEYMSFYYHDLVKMANELVMGDRLSMYKLMGEAMLEDLGEDTDKLRPTHYQQLAIADALTYIFSDQEFVAERDELMRIVKTSNNTWNGIPLEGDTENRTKSERQWSYKLKGVQIYGNGGAGKSTVVNRTLMKAIALKAREDGKQIRLVYVGQDANNVRLLKEAVIGLEKEINLVEFVDHKKFFDNDLARDVDLIVYDESNKITPDQGAMLMRLYSGSNVKFIMMGDMKQIGQERGAVESIIQNNVVDKLLPRTINIDQNLRSDNPEITDTLNLIARGVNLSKNPMKAMIRLRPTVYNETHTMGTMLLPHNWAAVATQWKADILDDMAKQKPLQRHIILDTREARDSFIMGLHPSERETLSKYVHFIYGENDPDNGIFSAQGRQFPYVYVAMDFPVDNTESGLAYKRVFYTAASRAVDFLAIPIGSQKIVSQQSKEDKMNTRTDNEEAENNRLDRIDAFFSTIKDVPSSDLKSPFQSKRIASRGTFVSDTRSSATSSNGVKISKGEVRTYAGRQWTVESFAKVGNINKVRVTREENGQLVTEVYDLERFAEDSTATTNSQDELALNIVLTSMVLARENILGTQPLGNSFDFSIRKSGNLHQMSNGNLRFPISLATITDQELGQAVKYGKEHIKLKESMLVSNLPVSIVYYQRLQLTDETIEGESQTFENGVLVLEQNGRILGSFYYPYVNSGNVLLGNSLDPRITEKPTWDDPLVDEYIGNLQSLWAVGERQTKTNGTNRHVILSDIIPSYDMSVQGGTVYLDYKNPKSFKETFDSIIERGGAFLSTDPSGNRSTTSMDNIYVLQSRGSKELKKKLLGDKRMAKFMSDPNMVYTYAFFTLTPGIPDSWVPIQILGTKIGSSQKMASKIKNSISQLDKMISGVNEEAAKGKKRDKFSEFNSAFDRSFANQTVKFNRSLFLKDGKIIPEFNGILRVNSDGHLEISDTYSKTNNTNKAENMMTNLKSAIDYIVVRGYGGMEKTKVVTDKNGNLESVQLDIRSADELALMTPVAMIQMPQASLQLDKIRFSNALAGKKKPPSIQRETLMRMAMNVEQSISETEEIVWDEEPMKMCKS